MPEAYLLISCLSNLIINIENKYNNETANFLCNVFNGNTHLYGL